MHYVTHIDLSGKPKGIYITASPLPPVRPCYAVHRKEVLVRPTKNGKKSLIRYWMWHVSCMGGMIGDGLSLLQNIIMRYNQRVLTVAYIVFESDEGIYHYTVSHAGMPYKIYVEDPSGKVYMAEAVRAVTKYLRFFSFFPWGGERSGYDVVRRVHENVVKAVKEITPEELPKQGFKFIGDIVEVATGGAGL